MEKKIVLEHLSQYPYKSVALGTTRANLTGLWRYWRPYYQTKRAPCDAYCPVGNHVVGFVQAAARGAWAEAASILRLEDPLAAITGRVCAHPCEVRCNRHSFDTPVAIRAIERAVGEQLVDLPPFPRPEPSRSAAVVGSGPEALTIAYYLALLGHQVTLFDVRPLLGGFLRYAVPPHLLPRDVVDPEIDRVLATGVRVERQAARAEELTARYDAVFDERELPSAPNLRIPGEDASGVMPGLDFARRVHDGETASVSGRVAVLGGGDFALDIATTVQRLGGDPVMICRTGRAEMAADPRAIEVATSGGVRLETLAWPVEVLVDAGRAVGLRLARGEHVEAEREVASSRQSASAVPLETWPFDLVIAAVGDPGANAVAPAVGRGKRTALVQDARWRGIDEDLALARIMVAGRQTVSAAKYRALLAGEPDDASEEVVTYEQLQPDFFQPAARLDIGGVMTDDQAAQEAERCLSCGLCDSCDNCWMYCPDLSISREGGEYRIDYEYCKGCNVCAAVCPRGVISVVEEKKWKG